ncbi:Chromatin remodeling factor mit [Salix suchowensis]|nr:Chromatin remodeling factor mit [Salix suchowensis]
MGKKKLALEHLIVKKMEDDDSAGEDIHSILTYGAKALFDDSEGASKDVTYSDADIDKLIERTEKETQVVEKKPEGGFSFEFAKIWSADKDSLEEVQETDGNDNSWSLTLQKIAAEQASARVAEKASGRGVRRKATNVAGPDAYRENPPTPVKSKKKTSKNLSDGSDYGAEFRRRRRRRRLRMMTKLRPRMRNLRRQKARNGKRRPAHQDPRSLNLSMFRMQRAKCVVSVTRITQATEANRAAIKAIDETLARRGDVHLLYGQPLALLDKQPARHSAANSSSTSHHHPVVPTIHYAANALAAAVAPPIPTHHSSVFPSTSQIVMHKPELSRPKPKKHMKPFQCPVCDQQTYHLVKDCPVVNLGSRR